MLRWLGTKSIPCPRSCPTTTNWGVNKLKSAVLGTQRTFIWLISYCARKISQKIANKAMPFLVHHLYRYVQIIMLMDATVMCAGMPICVPSTGNQTISTLSMPDHLCPWILGPLPSLRQLSKLRFASHRNSRAVTLSLSSLTSGAITLLTILMNNIY